MKRLILMLCLLLSVPLVAQETPGIRAIEFPLETYFVRLSPDGKTVAVYSDGIYHGFEALPKYLPIVLIDLESGAIRAELVGEQSDFAMDVAFSPDGQQLVSIHSNGTLYVWDASTGDLLQEKNFFMGANRLSVTDDQIIILSAGAPGSILVMDRDSLDITTILNRPMVSRQQFMEFYTQMPGRLDVEYVSLAATDSTVYTATGNDEILAWDITTGQMQSIKDRNEDMGRLSIRTLEVENDRLVAYLSRIGIMTFDLETGDLLEQVDLPDMLYMGISSDGNDVYWADRETNAIYYADAANPELANADVLLSESDAAAVLGPDRRVLPYRSLLLTPDGSKLLFGGIVAQEGMDSTLLLVIDLDT